MNTRSAAGIILIAVMAGCFACKGKEAPADVAAGTETREITAVVRTEKAADKKPYVKQDTYFKLPALAGGEIDLASYAGKPVLLMLFTENCPYCRRAAPALERIYKTYGNKGLTVLGVCIQDDAGAAKNFAADLGITFPLAYGGQAVYRQYKAQGVPYIYLLNARHEAVSVWPGYDQSFAPQIEKAVETELAKL